MICKQCGTDNAINRLYCDNCGAELQHDLSEIQAAVDREIKSDKAKLTTHSIRWLLGVSFLLFVVGVVFRNSYKDLPSNDVVAFIAAPNVEMGTPLAVFVARFGLQLPGLSIAPPPPARERDPAFRTRVAEEAYRRAAVSVQAKGAKEPYVGLIATDLVLQFVPTGDTQPKAIHAADITRLHPASAGLWDIAARSLDKPLQGTILDAASIDLFILRRTPDNKPVTEKVLLRNLTDLTPLEAPKAAGK